jgi:hypothetical protein
LELEIIAENEIVPIDQIGLIPPGAPIRLVAKFGPAAESGKVSGLEPKVFLETWRQFFFNVEDNVRKYRIPYNEARLAVFFPSMVGPRVTKKSNK